MARDYQMTGGFLDGVRVSFDKRNSILAEKSYPLGTFATEYLELDWHQVADLDRQMHTFVEEFTVFLSARDPSSAAVAQQALDAVWAGLRKLPVYRELDPHESVHGLLHYMREHPDEVDDMLTPGTGHHRMMERWLGRMRNFKFSIDTFVRETEQMFILYFNDLEFRRSEDYVEGAGGERGDQRRGVSAGAGQNMRTREGTDSCPPGVLFVLCDASFEVVGRGCRKTPQGKLLRQLPKSGGPVISWLSLRSHTKCLCPRGPIDRFLPVLKRKNSPAHFSVSHRLSKILLRPS